MKDKKTTVAIDNDNRIASGSITVVDYTKLIGVAASGSITVADYEELIGAKASGTITITAYVSLAAKSFTIGEDTVTEGVDFTAETSNTVTATNLAAAIDALTDYTASADGAVITITAAANGREFNEVFLSTNATAGYTFSADNRLKGGLDDAVITIGSEELVQGTDFTAETSNAVTATNLAAAIDALTDFVGAVDGTDDTKVNITAAAVGVAGNVALTAEWENDTVAALTLSGSTLTGGVDQGTITFNGVTYTQGTDFNAETDDGTTATNIATALDADLSFTASATDKVVSIVADAAGLAGNVGLTSNAPSALTLVAPTGGADYFYSDVLEYDTVDNPAIEVKIEVTAMSGAYVTAVVETSDDKDDWDAIYTFENFTTTGEKEKLLGKYIKSFSRVRISSDDDATVLITQLTSEYGGDEEPVDIKEETYTTKIEELETYTYIGAALPGTATSASNWQIKRITNATGDVLWADAVTTFTKEWDERATYTYS